MAAQLKSYQQRRIADSQVVKRSSQQPYLLCNIKCISLQDYALSQQLLTLYNPLAKVLCLLQAHIQGRGRLNAPPRVGVHHGVRG